MSSDNKTGSGPDAAAPDDAGSGAGQNDVTGISEGILEEAVRERNEYLDSLRRLQAEFDNYRKRVLRESDQLKARYSAEVIEEILPVLDNFERAMQAAAHDEQVLTDGVELVYNQLRGVLTKRGLCEIEAHGETFDPNRHEAIVCRPSPEHGEGKIIDVIEKGYSLQDQVVRPAKVIVSEGKKKG